MLGNVSKMEESLRKLKKVQWSEAIFHPFHFSYSKVRERQETREAKPGLSDDDKIRLQLYVDVHFLLGKLTEIGAIKEVTPNLCYLWWRGKVTKSLLWKTTTSHFQGCESQEKLANVVDEPVAKFIKDIQNIWNHSPVSPSNTINLWCNTLLRLWSWTSTYLTSVPRLL